MGGLEHFDDPDPHACIHHQSANNGQQNNCSLMAKLVTDLQSKAFTSESIVTRFVWAKAEIEYIFKKIYGIENLELEFWYSVSANTLNFFVLISGYVADNSFTLSNLTFELMCHLQEKSRRKAIETFLMYSNNHEDFETMTCLEKGAFLFINMAVYDIANGNIVPLDMSQVYIKVPMLGNIQSGQTPLLRFLFNPSTLADLYEANNDTPQKNLDRIATVIPPQCLFNKWVLGLVNKSLHSGGYSIKRVLSFPTSYSFSPFIASFPWSIVQEGAKELPQHLPLLTYHPSKQFKGEYDVIQRLINHKQKHALKDGSGKFPKGRIWTGERKQGNATKMRHLDSGTVCVDVYGNVVSAWNVTPGHFYFVNSDPVQHAYATIKMLQFPTHVAALDIATYRKFLYNASEGRVCVAAAHYTPNLFPFTAAEQITFLGNQRYINQDNFADGTPGKGFNVDVASLRQKLVVVCAEPGTGKTNLIKQIVDNSSQGARILLVAPGRALVDGLVDKLKSRHFASYRRVAGSPDPWENSDYIVSTPDSMINAVEGFDLIIFDEPDKSLTHITSTLFNNYTTGRVMDKILALVREAGTKTILLQAKITNPTVEFFLEACKVDRYDITESKFFNIDYAPPRAPFRLFSSLNQGLSEAIPKIISRIKAPEPVKALIFCHSLGTLLIISAMIQSQLEVHQRDTVIELYSNIIHTDAVKEYLRNPNHESQNKYQLCLFTSVADTGVSFEQRDIAVYVLENGVAGFNQLQQSCQRGRYYENQKVFVIMPKGLPSAQIVEKSHLRSNYSGLDTELKASCDDLAVKIPSQQWFNKYVTAAKEDEAASTHYSANNAYQLFAAQPGATEVLDANANTMTDDVIFINKLFTTMEYLISTEVAFETNPSSSLIGKLTRRTLPNVKNSVSRRFGIGGGPRLNRHEGGAGAGGRNAEAVIAANELDIFPEYHISTHTTLRFQQGLCTDVVVNLGKQIDLIHVDLTQTLD
ncbi:hypothetical protein HDU79_011379, partial [Rhizoclosmatium sp. JEL0117]